VQRHAGGPAGGVLEQVEDERVLHEPDPGVRPDGGDERPRHLGAGRVAAGVHDPGAGVPALAGQRQLAGGVAVEGGAQRDELAQPLRALGAQHAHGAGVAQPHTGHERVAQVLLRAVGRVECGRDPALCPAGRAVVDEHLGDEQHRAGVGGVQGGGEAGDPGPDDDDVGREHPAGGRGEQAGHRAGTGAPRSWSPRRVPLPGSASAGSWPVPTMRLCASTKTTFGRRVRASASSSRP